MLDLMINGEPKQVPEHTNITQLIEIMGLTGKRLAIEINREIVPRSTFDSRELQSDDQVEIVQAIGGGTILN